MMSIVMVLNEKDLEFGDAVGGSIGPTSSTIPDPLIDPKISH